MHTYIGPVGGMVPLWGVNSLEVSTRRPSAMKTTLGGRQKLQRILVTRREWAVSTNNMLYPGEAAGLLSLEAGSVPPWVWVDPWAQVTNVLSPEQSVLAEGSWTGVDAYEGGAATTSDGLRAVRTVTSLAGERVFFGFRDSAPDHPAVIPGTPITGSVYVRGAGEVTVMFLDWTGATLGAAIPVAYSHADLTRASVTVTPPEGATMVRLSVIGASQAAMPAVTWTSDAAEWSPGHGCNRVVVDGLSEAVSYADASALGLRRSGLSFTVREVG